MSRRSFAETYCRDLHAEAARKRAIDARRRASRKDCGCSRHAGRRWVDGRPYCTGCGEPTQ